MLATEYAIAYVEADLDKSMRSGTYSKGFLNDLALCVDHNTYNVASIISEIAILEGTKAGPSSTKAATEFGRTLRGLWHKHHTQARFIIHSIQSEMNKDGTVEKFFKPYMGETMTEEHAKNLINLIAVENFANRGADGRLTGEWIVFAKTPTGNRYLTLASHNEGDNQILDRISTYMAIETLPLS